nr:unnamed protein product [Callosobruchus chinensis]
MNSISLQTTFMFFPVDQPKHPEFDQPEKYGIEGVINFYLSVKDTDGTTPVSIGTWLIVPEDEKATTVGKPHSIHTAEEILRRTTKPVAIYMHGVACNRILPSETYAVARKEFMVLSMDHRGYGDSGQDVTMCEAGIVSDTRQIFKWVRSLTSNDIYFWGHSMGTALSTHTVRRLKEQDGIVPTGLILESAFTTMREEIVNNPLGKIFSWLLYFNATILDPLERNGFLFKTTENILSVDCPIMMMHAEDDNVIPWRLGFKLYQVAKTERNLDVQGSVNFTLFPSLGYYHIGITRDKKVPKMIQLLCLFLAVLIIIFIVLPLVVKYSFSVQQRIVFTHDGLPNEPKYFTEYYFPSFRNLYVPVTDLSGTTKHVLGVWHILPVEIAKVALNDTSFDYDEALADKKYDVIMYFHGTGESRSDSTRKYQLLSYYFHIITFDYRSYADSSKGTLTEAKVVNDCKQLYFWIRNKTEADIYVWGQSLGSSVAANTVLKLENDDIHPKGLILESGFTSFEEELYVHPYGKIFAWLPWFHITVVKPLHDNGFVFDTASYLKNINCSVMILHAEDDSIVPYTFGQKLYKIAAHRTGTTALSVYHQFNGTLGYDHYYIYQDPFLKYYIISIIFVLLFIIAFVIVPVVFKYSVGIQRSIIFPTWVISQKNYSDIQKFDIKGVRNFYITVPRENDISDNITLGLWQILPQEFLGDFIANDEYNYEGALSDNNYKVLLYLHGNGQDRASSLDLYDILRWYFLIIAVDYRGYGDSSKAELTETAIVEDIVNVYKWLKNQTNSKIYVWGHSLGTGVATHLISNLKAENISSNGLILETPFTSVTDVMQEHPVMKFYSFLPWFWTTMIEPIKYNDFDFDSKKYIVNVDNPIMILHAKDDDIISYHFATQLYNIAVNNRNDTYQGNVTYHLFEARGYMHMYLYKAPELPEYVREFLEDCDRFDKRIK